MDAIITLDALVVYVGGTLTPEKFQVAKVWGIQVGADVELTVNVSVP